MDFATVKQDGAGAPARSASTPSSSTTAGRRSRVTGTPTRRSTPSRAGTARATSKYKPRFPDATFAAVRKAIAPMKLGLWMSPMHFNPESATFRAHPDWACAPLGLGTTLVNMLQPDSSSNEAGIGVWGPKAIPHIESRIREAITKWQVAYFKFDFLMWVDCVGQGTMYDYQDAFVGDARPAEGRPTPRSPSRSTRPTTTGCSRSRR